MPLFSTSFTPPDPPANLEISAEVAASRILLTWTPTGLGVDFAGYRVYRSIDGGQTYVALILISDESTATFSDYEAPFGRSLLYRVTVASLDFESEPAEAAIVLEVDVGWWMVDPAGNVARTFALPYVVDVAGNIPLQRDVFEPIGRPRVLPVRGEALGEDLVLTIEAAADVADELWAKLRDSLKPPTEYVLVKSPFGEVFRASLGSLSRTRGPAGSQVFTVPIVEVA